VRSAAIHVLDEQLDAASGLAGTLSTTGVLQALFDFQPWIVRASRIRTMLQEDVDISVAADGRRFALIMLPLLEHGRHIGQLAFEAEAGTRFSDIQAKTALAIARQISSTIGSFNVAHDLRRVALFEERSAIARELHDSLAQSLAFMKIQIARMQAALGARKSPEETAAVLGELRDGLNGAYRKLRELLTTFRVNIGPGGLQAGLEETVQEVRQRSAMSVTLEWQVGNCRLSSNEEIHVLHVVREALSNAVRHAEADRVAISLEYDASRYLTVTVEDDGHGFEDAADRRFHHGLSIMEDRVASLGGSLVIDARPGGGTRVRFRFTPSWSGSRDLLAEQSPPSNDAR
jgi:two-component system, NarL family, nitrate/nitrite sensor histidine kinase NarX